jgi:hypothetical protein
MEVKGKKTKDYSKGKVYKIFCNLTNDIYYGSTIQTLSKRISQHREQLKKGKKMTSFGIIERGDYAMSLVESYPICKSREELLARERIYIENSTCVNKRVPGRTKKEHYQAYKEEIKKKKTEKYTCICGLTLSCQGHKARHERSAKHKTNLAESIKEEQQEVDC